MRTLQTLGLPVALVLWALGAMAQGGKAPTVASKVEVTVVEVAGGHAYLKPGVTFGVRRGATVTLRSKSYTVLSATASHAVIALGESALHEGDKGTAVLGEVVEDKAKELPAPRPVSSFTGIWPAPEAPALRQVPKAIPLGAEERNRRLDLLLWSAGGVVAPLGARGVTIGRAEVGARLHVEPMSRPFSMDLDLALQGWFAGDLSSRDGGSARPLLRVRELALSYGTSQSFGGSLGRLRYAASTLGMLDGARIRAPLTSGLTVSAFGGAIPNPLSGSFETASQRFGVEARYADPTSKLRPEAALVAHGSTYDARFDERRLTGYVALFPGAARFGGHFELSAFDRDNAFGASPLEVTAAGVDGSMRWGPLQIGARMDLRKQEASRWLWSFLGPSWFCTPVAGATVGDKCAPSGLSARYFASVDASLLLERFAFSAGATLIRDLSSQGLPTQLGGFLTGRWLRLLRHGRIDLTGSAATGTYVDQFGWSLGPGASLLADKLDVALYYRQGIFRYRPNDTVLLQHALGTSVMVWPRADVALALQGEGVGGDDSQFLYVFASAVWRPRL